jgi:hypothetical protein
MNSDEFLDYRQKIKNSKSENPKDYSINSKNLETNTIIYSNSGPFIFSDKQFINDFPSDRDTVDYTYEEVEIFQQFVGASKTDSPNIFSLTHDGGVTSPLYTVMTNDKIVKHLFIPTFCFGFFDVFEKCFNKMNENEKSNFKKSIETFINPKNNKWIFLRDLKIPSKELVASNMKYLEDMMFKDEWTHIFKSKEEFKVYAVVSKKSELIKMYKSFDSDVLNSEDIIHEPYQNIDYEPSGLLVGDLTFHGVMLY